MLQKVAVAGIIAGAGFFYIPQIAGAAGVASPGGARHNVSRRGARAIPALSRLVPRMPGALGRGLAFPTLPGPARLLSL
jgi:hypothetical protein